LTAHSRALPPATAAAAGSLGRLTSNAAPAARRLDRGTITPTAVDAAARLRITLVLGLENVGASGAEHRGSTRLAEQQQCRHDRKPEASKLCLV
jgi:hypothetical protein